MSYLSHLLLSDSEQNFHMVVDCANGTMKEHCYWPIVSDLINVLSHKSVAHKFLSDCKLLEIWFELIAYFQGKTVNSLLDCKLLEIWFELIAYFQGKTVNSLLDCKLLEIWFKLIAYFQGKRVVIVAFNWI